MPSLQLRHSHRSCANNSGAAILLIALALVSFPIVMAGCGSAGGASTVAPEVEPGVSDNDGGTVVDSNVQDDTPLRAIRAVPLAGEGSLEWSFNVVGASDAERDSLTFDWHFGDGRSAAGASATHRYASTGTYVVSLSAADEAGATAYALSEILTISGGGDADVGETLVVLMDAHVDSTESSFTLSGSARTNTLQAGETAEYEWLFADGETETGPEVTHVLVGESPYRVTVTATTSLGRTASHYQYFVLADSGQSADSNTNDNATDAANDNASVEDPTDPPSDDGGAVDDGGTGGDTGGTGGGGGGGGGGGARPYLQQIRLGRSPPREDLAHWPEGAAADKWST